MWGRATLATEESSTTMNVAVMTETAIIHRLAEGTQGAGCPSGATAGASGVAAELLGADGEDIQRVLAQRGLGPEGIKDHFNMGRRGGAEKVRT
jgi:hypothetical protein